MTEDQDVFRPAEYAWGSEPEPGAQRTSVPALPGSDFASWSRMTKLSR